MEIAVAQVFFLYLVVFTKKPEIMASPCRKTRSMRFCSGVPLAKKLSIVGQCLPVGCDRSQGCACLTQPLHAIENVQFCNGGTFKLSFEKGHNGRSHQKTLQKWRCEALPYVSGANLSSPRLLTR